MSQINRSDIYDKQLNFLIGSGASVGLLPTLSVKIKDSNSEKNHTFETLATHFSDDKAVRSLLFSCYVRDVIRPAATFNPYDISGMSQRQKTVVENYERFIGTILALLEKKPSFKRANVFTTNYDGMIAHAAERLIHSNHWDFTLNDGSTGFVRKMLQTRNFSRYVKDQGVFDRHEKSIPQINLIQPHGSVYWYKTGDHIQVSYSQADARARIDKVPLLTDDDFDAALDNATCTEVDLEGLGNALDDTDIERFWREYDALPVVNPTKWKFHETVFEEHYYQSLRLLSYELERPNSVFIVFGFSFADEHILNLIKRSLSNPSLKVYICCFSDGSKNEIEDKFEGARNVVFLRVDGDLDFSSFNNEVFSVSSAEGGVSGND
jgi:hypothetical protein